MYVYLLNSQDNWTLTFFLHDAVYLYLRTVNQTLAEGNSDFRDGRYIRNKTIGQRFVGTFLRLSVSYIWYLQKTRKKSYEADAKLRPKPRLTCTDICDLIN